MDLFQSSGIISFFIFIHFFSPYQRIFVRYEEQWTTFEEFGAKTVFFGSFIGFKVMEI